MDVWNFLSVGVSTLILLVLIHLAVFYVVKTLYPPRTPIQQPQVQFQPEPMIIQPPPPPPPVALEIPLVTTKLPPPVDTRDPGPSRPVAPTFSEAPKENEVKQSVNVPTYESLLSSVAASKEGQSNLGPMSGPTN
jgi:hypothetical protein